MPVHLTFGEGSVSLGNMLKKEFYGTFKMVKGVRFCHDSWVAGMGALSNSQVDIQGLEGNSIVD